MAQQRIYKQPQRGKRDDDADTSAGITSPSGRPVRRQESVYDPESDDSLSNIDKVLADQETLKDENQESAESGEKSPAQLKESEEQADSSSDAEEKFPDERPLYKSEKGEDAKKSAQSTKSKGLKGIWQKHKKKIIVGGVGGVGSISIIMLLLFLASSLLLPNFLQTSLAYRMATSARSYRQANEQNLSRKLGLDKLSDSKYAQLKARFAKIQGRFSDAKKMVLLENYRPKKVAENMRSTDALDFIEEKRGLRTVITAIVVNGERIPLTSDHTSFAVTVYFCNPLECIC